MECRNRDGIQEHCHDIRDNYDVKCEYFQVICCKGRPTCEESVHRHISSVMLEPRAHDAAAARASLEVDNDEREFQDTMANGSLAVDTDGVLSKKL